jgi:hypothetical protein
MSKHLQTTKEAYLEMMKSLLEERREITAAYNEIKGKVAEIDKMLLAGDSGKVTKEEVPNVIKEEVPEVKLKPEYVKTEGEKLKITIPVEEITTEKLEILREAVKKAQPFKQAPKEKLNVAQATEQMKEAFMNFGKAANEFKNRTNPQKEDKPKKKQGGGGLGSRGGVTGKKGREAIVEILKERGSAMKVTELQKELSDRFNTEVLIQSLSMVLHTMKKKDKRIQSAGRGYVIFKD